MTVNERIVREGKLNLCLPEFTQEDTPESDIMNELYKRLEHEIRNYAAAKPNLRRYTTSFSVTKDGELIHVTVDISVRMMTDTGKVKLLRRKIHTVWHGARLDISYSDVN